MAKLAVTVAVFLFTLALAQALIPLDHKENDVITHDVSTNQQESDLKSMLTLPASILLPSQKLEAETERVAETKPSESGISGSEKNHFLPSTVVKFHPINHRFRRDPSFTLRQRRPCRQHSLGKPWGPWRIHHREMSYGNDMLVSTFDGEELSVIPTERLKFPRGGAHVHRFPFRRDDDVANQEGFRRPHHHPRHHFDRADWVKESAGHEEQTGFMSKIRKFLNHF